MPLNSPKKNRTPAPAKPAASPRLRLGLCCQFVEQPIQFRTTTATSLQKHSRPAQLAKLSELSLANADSLLAALTFCRDRGIRSFRIISPILPLKTHPAVGYELDELPGAGVILDRFKDCARFARTSDIRTGFHPDQFVVLNSPDAQIVSRSIADIESQAEIAEWTGADTVNIHGGGAYGDKKAALNRFLRNLDLLSERARTRLTVENDDKTFTPSDLLPICKSGGIPLVYDVHHHRCCPDRLSVAEATEGARSTWNREPLFHISSPIEGWNGPNPLRHHDYIDVADFPAEWLGSPLTVEVEAKAKELAVLKLARDLEPLLKRPGRQ